MLIIFKYFRCIENNPVKCCFENNFEWKKKSFHLKSIKKHTIVPTPNYSLHILRVGNGRTAGQIRSVENKINVPPKIFIFNTRDHTQILVFLIIPFLKIISSYTIARFIINSVIPYIPYVTNLFGICIKCNRIMFKQIIYTTNNYTPTNCFSQYLLFWSLKMFFFPIFRSFFKNRFPTLSLCYNIMFESIYIYIYRYLNQ